MFRLHLPVVLIAGLLLPAGLSGCTSSQETWNWRQLVTGAAPASTTEAQDGLKAAYWVQRSAEYQAAVDLTFDLATLRLDEALNDPNWTALDGQSSAMRGKPPAIILDVDETALDNSAYQIWTAQSGESYSPETWQAFVNAQESLAIKPALTFTQYAASKGVEVFYVTNRRIEVKSATLENLASEGFPLSDDVDTLLVRNQQEDWGSEKQSRWDHVAKDYRVVMLIGDNLGDVSEGVYVSPDERLAIVEANRDKIGTSWIVLPNPTYGSWEGAALGYDFGQSQLEKIDVMMNYLRSWTPKETPVEGGTSP